VPVCLEWRCLAFRIKKANAGPQAAFGYALVAAAFVEERLGGSTAPAATLAISAGVGLDLPEAAEFWLQAHGVDLIGLQRRESPLPTPRAWQLFERDGHRTQVWRSLYSTQEECCRMLRPSFESMCAASKRSKAFHIGIHPGVF
jgi:hypothetical protein